MLWIYRAWTIFPFRVAFVSTELSMFFYYCPFFLLFFIGVVHFVHTYIYSIFSPIFYTIFLFGCTIIYLIEPKLLLTIKKSAVAYKYIFPDSCKTRETWSNRWEAQNWSTVCALLKLTENYRIIVNSKDKLIPLGCNNKINLIIVFLLAGTCKSRCLGSIYS